MKIKILFFLLFLVAAVMPCISGTHPNMLLTRAGVREIQKWSDRSPAFRKSLADLKRMADLAMQNGVVVPVPKDEGGGYTHEKNKNNYAEMNAAAILYQITGDKAYAGFVRDMLMEYAGLYPTLGLHPSLRSSTRGKLFWQTLNESVWLVHAACAYDCVYDFISASERQYMEENLFYPMAGFITNGNPENYAVFNKMHNHGTWANAAVGMIGYVMGDRNLVDMALYGSLKDGSSGFFKQLDQLFSPDGYFTEGPYYHRYALWPFMTFAQVIQNQQPELDVFGYREGILFKAVDAMIQQSYNGELFLLNDALPKSLKSKDIVSSVDIAVKNNPENKSWLEVARYQDDFLVSDAGISTARALLREKPGPVVLRSAFLSDGPAGDAGGIAILRGGSRTGSACLTFKATSHGLSHGHYDKLSLSFYDNGNRVITDYGSSRFLNIESKSGGNYTPENYTWAMQSIAHNTVSINEKCQFDGNIKVSSRYHSDINYHDFSDPSLQVVSGTEKNAFPGVTLQRTVAMIRLPGLGDPVVLDLFRVRSGPEALIDLPFYFNGDVVFTSFVLAKNRDLLKPLGKENGYQHLWLEASGRPAGTNAVFTWINGSRFYNLTTLSDSGTQVMMVRTGANDPEFNLRSEQGIILRQSGVAQHTFVSVIEPHGLYDLTNEVTAGIRSQVSRLQLLEDTELNTVVRIALADGSSCLFIAVNADFDADKRRTVTVEGDTIQFKGNFQLVKETI